MFVVSEAEAAAIRAAFDRGGEFSAAIESIFYLTTGGESPPSCASANGTGTHLKIPHRIPEYHFDTRTIPQPTVRKRHAPTAPARALYLSAARQFQAANPSRRSRARRISAIAPGCPISRTSRSIRRCSRLAHASVSHLRNWTDNGVLSTAPGWSMWTASAASRFVAIYTARLLFDTAGPQCHRTCACAVIRVTRSR